MHRSQKRTAAIVMAAGLTAALPFTTARAQEPSGKPEPVLRPPAVPLVASDPYLSI